MGSGVFRAVDVNNNSDEIFATPNAEHIFVPLLLAPKFNFEVHGKGCEFFCMCDFFFFLFLFSPLTCCPCGKFNILLIYLFLYYSTQSHPVTC